MCHHKEQSNYNQYHINSDSCSLDSPSYWDNPSSSFIQVFIKDSYLRTINLELDTSRSFKDNHKTTASFDFTEAHFSCSYQDSYKVVPISSCQSYHIKVIPFQIIATDFEAFLA